jgi:hypothetical protein
MVDYLVVTEKKLANSITYLLPNRLMQVFNNGRIMSEEFLHYLWKYRLLDPELMTVGGEKVVVIHPGEHNTDGGPDFFNARLRIRDTTWAGNVEIHVKSSVWYKHRHQEDPAYDNVILHAVFEHDAEVTRRSEEKIPTIELKGRFPEYIYDRYRDFQDNLSWIPCQAVIKDVDPFIFEQWIPALALEKIEDRIGVLKKSLEACKYDWEETFYRNLARSFGFRINAQAFELLARSLPFKLLQRHRNDIFQLEALLFGQAGMLEEAYIEEYPRLLRNEYYFLRDKYKERFNLRGIPVSVWKFLRLRPSNFPALRIAQFAGLIHKSKDLFSNVLESSSPKEIASQFDVNASEYWDSHFLFGRWSSPKPKTLGISSIRLIIVNFVAPFLFLYGDMKSSSSHKEKGLSFLERLPPENNTNISKWMEMEIPVPDALHSQALLHLKQNYCDKKRCLDCRIGNKLLNRETVTNNTQRFSSNTL